MTKKRSWLRAEDAAEALGVSRATLYAYVSRGLIRSQPVVGSSRQRSYSRDDVERLRNRALARRDPGKAITQALRWGLPVLSSSITLIDDEMVYYRGHNALDLARSRSVEEIASLIWTGGFDVSLPHEFVRSNPAEKNCFSHEMTFVARAQCALAAAAAKDTSPLDRDAKSLAACGWRILRVLAEASVFPRLCMGPTVEEGLASAWEADARALPLLRRAIILCADHELNVSSFTARCVASAGASPYGAVIAGLAALEGTKHGGASSRVEFMLASLRSTKDLRRALVDRLRCGEQIQGFGHPLYPHGDPRAAALIELLRELYGRSAELKYVIETADAASQATGRLPNLDFALGGISRVLRLEPGSALKIFAIGRTIGWIGHVIEQYDVGQVIRPRANYTGVVPLIVDRLGRHENSETGRAEE